MPKQKINFLDQQRQHHRQGQPEPPQRPLFFIVIGLLVVFLLFSGVKALFGDAPSNDPLQYDPVTLEPKKPKGLIGKLKYFVFQKEPALEGAKRDRINVLLLGMGGLGHDGPFLTDTIILVSLKPSTKEVAMITIPRDLGVKIPGKGWYKINHANAFGEATVKDGGAAFAAEVVENMFDLKIDYFGRIDFKAFEKIVDHVGGVTVNVDRAFVDEEYPAADEEYQTLTFTRGVQTMGGKRALQYARSRHGSNGEGSDFARSRRQLKILLALKEKVLSFKTLTNPVRINNILKTLDSHIVTNVEFADMLKMVKLARSFDTDNIKTLTLDNGIDGFLKNGVGHQGAFILEPVTGNFKDIRAAMKYIFDEEAEVTKNDTPDQDEPPLITARIELLNGTWKTGLASRTKQRLVDKKFTVASIGNTSERPVAQGGIYLSPGKSFLEVTDSLKDLLGLPVYDFPPQGITPRADTDILIILGDDYTE